MAKLTRRDFGSVPLVAATAMAATTAAPAAENNDIAALYGRSDAMDLAASIRRGEVSPSELLEEAIRRADDTRELNAVTLRHDALARARAEKPVQGPFAGVPFLLKDLGAQLKGTPTTGGSRSLMGLDAPADNELVKRFKQAGLNTFGKTNTPEFGMAFTTEPTAYGACRNPWNVAHTPAGSSGGSAAAVAAGVVPVAHASDGGGSIRVPASACGLFGLKPTRLRTPRGPGGNLGVSAMSVAHVISRSVRDSALMLDALSGYEPGAPFAAPGQDSGFFAATTQPPKRLRVALSLDERRVDLDPSCKNAVLEVAKLLESLGHSVEETAPDLDFESINNAQTYLVMAEFSNGMMGLARALKKPVEKIGLEPLSLHIVKRGAEMSAADYINHCHAIYAAGSIMGEFQGNHDLILQPTTATPPPKLGILNYQPDDDYVSFIDRFRLYAAYSYLYNLTGQPSASIPAGFTKTGLPLGAMLSGRNGEDALVLAVAAELEIAKPWFNQRPA